MDDHFLLRTRSSTIVQSLGEIVHSSNTNCVVIYRPISTCLAAFVS